MIKNVFGLVVLLAMGYLMWGLIPLSEPTPVGSVGTHYIEKGLSENRASNLVTSVIVNYRGFDTLGEVTVLFLSVAGATFVLRRKKGNKPTECRPSSEILQTGARMLFGPIVLFGAYIFVHGHLSPGGGFQGGAVVASAVMLLLLANRDHHLPHRFMHWMESMVGFTYVMVGIVGLVVAGSFLSNQGILPLGTWNRLFSGGLIPIIYTLVGLKVGTELSALLDTMMDSSRPESSKGGGH